MALPMCIRADRAVVRRQKKELVQETMLAGEVEQYKLHQKALFENKTAAVILDNRVKQKAQALQAQSQARLQDRRRRLAEKLSSEQRALEQEMVEREETPQQRTEKMAARAYELKKRREDERKAIVQEKLTQQWRTSIDDLRVMDSKIVQLQTIADRDHQLVEKEVKKQEEKAHHDFYDKVWHEGYLKKIEREEREKKEKAERADQLTKVLGVQLSMKGERVEREKEVDKLEADELKKVWAAQEEEEKNAVVRQRIMNREARAKADEYMAIQQAQRAAEAEAELDFDKRFVNGVLAREQRLAQIEEEEKAKAKRKAVEYTEALKIEMAKKAESEEELVRLQHEESERQWQKRYDQWEKEEMARRHLMEDVYQGRAMQLTQKEEVRKRLAQELDQEKQAIDQEVTRLEAFDQASAEGEKSMMQRHQEDLFRQMDFHQLQKQRQLHQTKIEQRQAILEEKKIQRKLDEDKKQAETIMQGILDGRKANAARRTAPTSVAPWDK